MRALFSAFWRDSSGATAIEYALIAILISVAGIAGMSAIGTWLNGTFAGFAGDL
ncbi:MAG TPA: Flp family type IVb pilin [Stellaceae bacterium]|jgi:Flp pilus assembly pilin Flp|nr:Flp family type IVb pilin [Stellaceae bacterium]